MVDLMAGLMVDLLVEMKADNSVGMRAARLVVRKVGL